MVGDPALVRAVVDLAAGGAVLDVALQTAAGTADGARGIREFVVGTGGKSHYGFVTLQPNSKIRNSDTYGVLMLALHASSYDWHFVSEAGYSFTDSGSQPCH